MKKLPATSAELKDALAAVFPGLPRDFGAWGESVLEDAGPTYASLLREFALYFERNADTFPDRQLRRFAELVVRCEQAGGPIAEALQACVVGPLAQAPDSRFGAFLEAARAR
ncbi:hypothetical protein H8N03_24610 [Ramlibacter sp. USB13]|uniref:Uncharacterized protein n=1 Tax=Ramlibacter cellulosilyticus TaxID=2764187 RepID=A0A923SDP6_9BURK|nr:hypothetical protein [Ramlibacter cellulosilyticus]MBC5786144.1 hypothetical protein [Ramlibacter cellulosilyticus]